MSRKLDYYYYLLRFFLQDDNNVVMMTILGMFNISKISNLNKNI